MGQAGAAVGAAPCAQAGAGGAPGLPACSHPAAAASAAAAAARRTPLEHRLRPPRHRSVSVYPTVADAAWNQPYRATTDYGDALNGTYGEGGVTTVNVKASCRWGGWVLALRHAARVCCPQLGALAPSTFQGAGAPWCPPVLQALPASSPTFVLDLGAIVGVAGESQGRPLLPPGPAPAWLRLPAAAAHARRCMPRALASRARQQVRLPTASLRPSPPLLAPQPSRCRTARRAWCPSRFQHPARRWG